MVSPLGGRQKACEAKLDICFKGVEVDYYELGFKGCMDACSYVVEKPSCSISDCESRCAGLFDLGPKCDDNLVIPLSDDPEADVFLVETPNTFFGVVGNQLMSPLTGRTRACAAKLDVCFGNGHQTLGPIGDLYECYDECDAELWESKGCDLARCESRCWGMFNPGQTCD